MLVKISRKDTTTVVAALARHISKLPEELRRSLTWDQGKEMHAHRRFTIATNVQVHFLYAQSPAAAQTKTPTAYCVSISRGQPTSSHLSEASKRDCSAAQSTSAKDLGLRNASR